MFSRLATLLPIAALVAVATAAPNVLEARQTSQCNGGSTTCCNQVLTTGFTATVVGGILDIIPGVGVPVGLTCDPITVIGLGSGAQCSVQQNGVVNVGCSPIDLNVA
ncbi:fungal hydrophobin [Imleria badia]|nr:fungal hydrophobin [Imleria badia]